MGPFLGLVLLGCLRVVEVGGGRARELSPFCTLLSIRGYRSCLSSQLMVALGIASSTGGLSSVLAWFARG